MALRAPVFATPAISQQDQEAFTASGMSSLRRGYEAGRIGTDINAAAAQEASLRRAAEAGDVQALAEAEALRANIGNLQQRQAMYAPQIGRVEDIGGVGDALSWAAGQVGQGAASMQDPLAVGVALQGAGRLASTGPGVMKAVGAGLRGAGYAIPFAMNQRQMTGEAYNAMAADEALMARTSAAERELNANLYGVGAGALDTVVPGMIAGKLTGAGLRQGVSQSGLGARTLKGMGMEGMTEVGQQFGQQQLLGYMNPDRDTSGDFMDNVNAFAGGAIGAGPMVMAGEMADSGYRRTGDTAKKVSEKTGEVVDLLQEKAGPYTEKAKSKLDQVVDLFAGEDGKVTPSSVKDKVTGKAKDMYADFDQKLQERDLIAGMPPEGLDPESQEFRDWHSQTHAKRTQAVSDKLGAMADAGDQRAQELYAQLDTPDDALFNETIEDGAKHILESDEWGRFSQEVERRAKQASRWSTKFGELAGKAGRMAGGAAVNFGKAVVDGVKSGTKKNMQIDPFEQILADQALEGGKEYVQGLKEAEGRAKSYRRAELFQNYLTEMLQTNTATAQRMGGSSFANVPPESMTGFAKDMALEIADLAENWKPTAKSKGPNPAPSGPTSTLKNPADSRGQQFDGLTFNLNQIARNMKLMYGDQAGQVLNELQAIDGNTAPEMFDLIRSELDVQGTRAAAQHNARVEREAQDALINTLAAKIEPELEGQLRTGAGKKKLLDMVKAIDDGVAPPAAKREFEKVFGKEALLALRRTLRPSRASQDDLMDDGATVSGLEMNDDGEVEVGEINNLDKAVGETTAEKLRGPRVIKHRNSDMKLERGAKGDIFARDGKVTRQQMLEAEDVFMQRLAEGAQPELPRNMQRPVLAKRGDKFTSGEDVEAGLLTRLEASLGVDRSPEAMRNALRKDAASARKMGDMDEFNRIVAQGKELATRMEAGDKALAAEARKFFEDRNEGGKWTTRTMTVKEYLDEEGADPARRISLYRDYLRQDAAGKGLTPEQRKAYGKMISLTNRVLMDQMDGNDGAGLRTSPEERKQIRAAANRYFSNRIVAIGEQEMDATPEQLSGPEVKEMADLGARIFAKARQGLKEGTSDYNQAVSAANLLVFQGKDKEIMISADTLAKWGREQRAKNESTKAQTQKGEKDEKFSDASKDKEFVRDLSSGIAALLDSGAVDAKAQPYKLNSFGEQEFFQLDFGAVQGTKGDKAATYKMYDGLPPSLVLATTNVFGARNPVDYRRKKALENPKEPRPEDSVNAEKLRDWTDEPFVASQDVANEGVHPNELWGTLGSVVKTAGGQMTTDKSQVTGATTRRNTGSWKTTHKDGIYSELSRESTPSGMAAGAPFVPHGEGQTVTRTSKVTAEVRAEQETLLLHALTEAQRTKYRRMAKRGDTAGIAKMIEGLPLETREQLALTGVNGARFAQGNPSFKTANDSGFDEHGGDAAATPGDFGDNPEAFDDVRSRTKAVMRDARKMPLPQREIPLTAAARAGERAEAIIRNFMPQERDEALEAKVVGGVPKASQAERFDAGVELIKQRLRMAARSKNDGGGPQYAVPVVVALSDENMARMDITPEQAKDLRLLRISAQRAIDESDSKTLKAKFGTKPAAKGVGASLGKPSGVGKSTGDKLNAQSDGGLDGQNGKLISRLADGRRDAFDDADEGRVFARVASPVRFGPAEKATKFFFSDGDYTHAYVIPNRFLGAVRQELKNRSPEMAQHVLAYFAIQHAFRNRQNGEFETFTAPAQSAAGQWLAEIGATKDTGERLKNGTPIHQLKDVTSRQVADFLADAVAYARKIEGTEKVFVDWERLTGANKGRRGSGWFNAQQPGPKASTQAERDAATAEIVKTLGKDIDVRFEQTTGFSGAYLDKEAAIVISLTPAAGTLQTAYHEALHAFVARLVKGNDRAKEVLNALANHQPTIQRIHALLDGYPEAQAQLADGEERIAYAYQFWRAGLLDLPVSPARTLLQKLRKFFRGVFGQVSDLERSSDLLDAFARGSYAGDPSVAGKVMAKHLLAGTWTARTLRKMDGLTQAIAAAVVPAQSLLLISESPTAQKLGNTFWTNPGDEESAGMKEGYLNARERMAKRYTNEFSRIVSGLTERDHKDVITYLQKETDPASIPYEPHREAVEKIRALLQRFRTYMVDERGHKIGDRGPLYFPRVWSAATLREKKDAFISMMQTNHPSYDAEAVYNALVKNFEESNEDALHGREMDDDAILSPTQSAKGDRVLGFITGEQAQPFLEQSLVGTLSRYFHEGARAAEYTHRFGRKGERLELALSTIHAELRQAGAKKRKAGELKDQDAETKWVERQMRDVERSVDAMEGTLGRDIGDNWRATNSWVTVYQNVRLLPLALFSSIVDPLGMVARGATMREAYDGFLRGMSEVVRNWGEMITGDVKERKLDKWERLASAVGSVDAAVWNHHVSDEYASVYMSPAAKKINDIMFKANGMEAWNRGMRIAATRSAVMFIQRHKSLPDTHSARWLEEIGLKPADIDISADGELITDKHTLATHLGIDKDAAAAKIDKIHYAINRWVQGAILTPNAAQRPAWGSDPHYSMFFHLKQFSYSFHQTLIKRAVNELDHGNLAPLGAFLWYIPVMIASDITKGLIQGGGELPAHMKGMDLGDWLLHGAQRAGLLGVGQMGVDATGDLSSIGGPAVEQVIDAFSDPLERTTIKAMPAHGLYAEALR